MGIMKISLVALLLFCGCADTPCETKIIATVGGCNTSGLCGVMYTDGTFGRTYFPVLLQEVCK